MGNGLPVDGPGGDADDVYCIAGRIGSHIVLGDGDVAQGSRAAHGGGITAACTLGDGDIAAENW